MSDSLYRSRWFSFLNSLQAATRRRKGIPELEQMDATECGAACIAMILNYYGRKTSVAEVREHCGVGRNGISAHSIVNTARYYGLRVRAISLPLDSFRYVKLPAIIHWEFKHFVVVERWSPRRINVIDPAYGKRSLTAEEFDTGFTGVVILLEPGANFSRESKPTRLSLWSYMRAVFRLPGFLVQILCVSLFLQLLGLIIPLTTKIIIDQVIPGRIENLMPMIGCGLLVIVLMQVTTILLRGLLLIYLQARVDIQMMLSFFEHLLSLPYQFFQQRSSGDLLTRLNSSTAIRDTMTNQMISTLLDGGTVVVYFLILLSQSSTIALGTLFIGLLQISMLLVTARLIRDMAKRDLIAQGKAQGYMTEALAGIATIKAAGAELRVWERWSNLFFLHLNLSVKRDSLSSVLDTAMNGLRLFSPLLLLWIGTIQVLNGSMTVGTMLALNALAAAFLTPLGSLASSGQRLQVIQAHFERIADVVGTDPEQDSQKVQLPPQLSGGIDLKQVSFRYDLNSAWVLQDINIHIEPGQKIALVGQTGSGKSTLGKLLLALYPPSKGDILYDGLSLQSLNYQALRSQIGAVLQESWLFSGSIRENITLNKPELELEQVVEAARAAAIHNDILRMPMGYDTLVAEGGSAISGGQRQRLAIARAMASKPAIILFDEATSHLDMVTEQIVDHNLNALACTRIVIAHRLSTVRNADCILVLDDGVIVERGTHDELLANGNQYARLVQSQLIEYNGSTEMGTQRVDVTTKHAY